MPPFHFDTRAEAIDNRNRANKNGKNNQIAANGQHFNKENVVENAKVKQVIADIATNNQDENGQNQGESQRKRQADGHTPNFEKASFFACLIGGVKGVHHGYQATGGRI